MRYVVVFFIAIIFPLQGMAQYEQYLEREDDPTSMKQVGVAFSVLEHGTGIGGFYELPLPWFFHVGASANFYFLRDSKQIDYYDPYYNYPITMNKKNNAYLMDLFFSIKKRLFVYSVDDSFQPYISVSAGPVYGINFPEPLPDGKQLPDQRGWTVSAMGAVGVNAVVDNNYIFGVRLQYRYMDFGHRIGEKANHSTFDLRIELGKRF